MPGLSPNLYTISRANLQTADNEITAIGNGGLSGAPLRERATAVIRYLAEKSNGEIPIIGVGGISSGADAVEKLEAGACLIQVYSGMVYRGPGLIREICEAVIKS